MARGNLQQQPNATFYVCFLQRSPVMKKSNTGLCVRLLQFTLRSTCKCAYVCVYMLSQFRDHKDYVRSRIKIDSVVCLYTPVSPSMPEVDGIYASGGILSWRCTFDGVIYTVFTRTPVGVTVGDSSLCCCVPCCRALLFPFACYKESYGSLVTEWRGVSIWRRGGRQRSRRKSIQ